MSDTYEILAGEIKSNGSRFLIDKKIEELLQPYGTLYYTGSYALDLMTWNDIDMQIVLNKGLNPLDAISQFYIRIAHDKDFVEAQLINFTGKYKPKMPRGLFLGLKFDSPEFGGIWKLDLWSLDKNDFEKNRLLIEKIKHLLKPELRSLILELKNELMQPTGRVPQMGSHFLYQAVLLENFRKKEEIFKYLVSHGVTLA